MTAPRALMAGQQIGTRLSKELGLRRIDGAFRLTRILPFATRYRIDFQDPAFTLFQSNRLSTLLRRFGLVPGEFPALYSHAPDMIVELGMSEAPEDLRGRGFRSKVVHVRGGHRLDRDR